MHQDDTSPVEGSAPDLLLVEQIRRGDADAGRRFFREYYPDIYRYLLWLAERPEAAEDLAQETFVRAWRHLGAFDGRASLRTWLHRIAHREFLRFLRNQRAQGPLDEAAEVADARAIDWTDAIELRELVRKLPAEEAEVVVLHYLQGYDCGEMARIVGAPVSTVKYRLLTARGRLQRELGEGDLVYLNEPATPMPRWRWLPLDQLHELEMSLTSAERSVFGGRGLEASNPNAEHRTPNTEGAAGQEETMERREFLRHAAVGAAGLLLPEAEREVVDDRLTTKVACAFKGAALSDVCERLRQETGVHLAAGPSVADEKVTLFCKKRSLREVMRQLSRPFGYTWLRSGKEGEYRYELVQDLRSQLLEEELRSRDRDAALLAMDREMQQYRPYLDLSPEEAEARARTAVPGEKERLENLARYGWGPIQMYFRLSGSEMAALRAGQTLVFSQEPGVGREARPGEQPLSSDVARGVLQGLRDWRVAPPHHEDDLMALVSGSKIKVAEWWPDAQPPAAVPEVRVRVDLSISQSEPGRFIFSGGPAAFSVRNVFKDFDANGPNGPWAVGISPSVLQPDNAALNARLAQDPAMRGHVTLRPEWNLTRTTLRAVPPPSLQGKGETQAAGSALKTSAAAKSPLPASGRGRGRGSELNQDPASRSGARSPSPGAVEAEPQVTSADVLEALHHATGLPIVSDFYTHLYKPEAVSAQDQPLFEALCHVCDAMGQRWTKDAGARAAGAWIQCRSMSFYEDRLKEVPNRLLVRWSEARRQHGILTLDDLVEIATLSDAQLDGVSMAEGARVLWGLAEWELARHAVLRPLLRDLARFTPAQRQEAMSPTGLLFSRMSLEQQQLFLARALRASDPPLRSFDELEGAFLLIDYIQPGWFEWVPCCPGPWQTWLMPVGSDRRAPRPRLRARTKEEALRRVDPKLRDLLWASKHRDEPKWEPPASEAAEIYATRLDLIFVYVPGAAHQRLTRIFGSGGVSCQRTS